MKLQKLFIMLLITGAVLFAMNSNAQRIYKVTSPSEAHVKVYVTNDVNQADIKVKSVQKAEDANKDGLWFETSTASEAMLKVYETTNASEADLKVYYVTDELEAGWVTTNKRQFFKGDK